MNNKPEGYSSRTDKRKDKKINKIYNILITVVIILIIAVGATIFTGKDADVSTSPKETLKADQTKQSDTNQKADKNQESDKNQQSDEGQKSDEDKEETPTDENDSADDKDKNKSDESKIVEEAPTDSNVNKAYSDTSWQSVGTSQKGEHVTQFDQSSVDWKEMERALAYGAGINEKDMTTWFIGNGGAPDKAVGTISPKDGSQTFRVHIEWIDGEGWKPTKVEELARNDKGR